MAGKKSGFIKLLNAKGLYVNKDGELRLEKIDFIQHSSEESQSLSVLFSEKIPENTNKARNDPSKNMYAQSTISSVSVDKEDSIVVQHLKSIHFRILVILMFCILYPIVYLMINKNNRYDKSLRMPKKE